MALAHLKNPSSVLPCCRTLTFFPFCNPKFSISISRVFFNSHFTLSRSSLTASASASASTASTTRIVDNATSSVDIPVTCYRLLGVGNEAEKDEIVKSLMQLKNSEVEEGFTMDAVVSRQETWLKGQVLDVFPDTRKLPILLFDIMDTVVNDPFYHHIPSFFGMSMEELIECKHPTAWIEFEKGIIDEIELSKKFFKDGRDFDLEGLKNCMRRAYSYIDGVEKLLQDLKENSYEMHAFTNYPIWYTMIEEKLNVSTYLSWTFCSYLFEKISKVKYILSREEEA